MLLLARVTGQYLQPLFVECTPGAAVRPTPTKVTQRFTELSLDEDETVEQDSALVVHSARVELVSAVHQLLAVARRQPFTLVTKLVRDVGVMRPVLKIAVLLGWQTGMEDRSLQASVTGLLDSCVAVGVTRAAPLADVGPSSRAVITHRKRCRS